MNLHSNVSSKVSKKMYHKNPYKWQSRTSNSNCPTPILEYKRLSDKLTLALILQRVNIILCKARLRNSLKNSWKTINFLKDFIHLFCVHDLIKVTTEMLIPCKHSYWRRSKVSNHPRLIVSQDITHVLYVEIEIQW